MNLAREARVDKRIFDHPHLVKQLEVAHEGIVFPLRDEYRRVNYTLEGRKESSIKAGDFGVLDWPDDAGDTPAQADHWLKMSSGWLRIHTVPRSVSECLPLNTSMVVRPTLLTCSLNGSRRSFILMADITLSLTPGTMRALTAVLASLGLALPCS